jgi:pimeloyl-ACP methyl ester carboxylesterase
LKDAPVSTSEGQGKLLPLWLAGGRLTVEVVDNTVTVGFGGGQLPCLLAGAGELVVLDYVLGRVVWGDLGRLASGCRLAVPEWPDLADQVPRPRYDRWFDGLVDGCGADSATLVTWSMGAPGAVQYAASAPGRLSRLVVVDPAGLHPPPAPLGGPRDGAPPPPPDVVARRRWSGWVRNPAVDRRPLEAALLRFNGRPGVRSVTARSSDAASRGPLVTLDRPLAIPTTLFVGRHSRVCGPDVGAAVAAGLGAELVVFEDSSHAVQLDEPERFADELVARAARQQRPA